MDEIIIFNERFNEAGKQIHLYKNCETALWRRRQKYPPRPYEAIISFAGMIPDSEKNEGRHCF